MNLQRNGVFGRWYKWNYDRYTSNFCTFFWCSIWALLCLPLSIGSIWFKYGEGLTHRILLGVVTYVLLFFISVIGYSAISNWVLTLEIIGIGLGVLITALLIILAIIAAQQSKTWDETIDVIVTKKDSIKNKYCPHINWV